jgi:predicted O-methyltransferase YrrM
MKLGLHGLFVLGQRCGVDILPRHFYSSIPDLRKLQRTTTWRKPSAMIGVAGADIDSQWKLVEECCRPYQARLAQGGIHEHACKENGEPGYGLVEAEFLYCFIRSKRPKKIVQVGCGVSTAVIQLAAKEEGYKPQIVCIDPYPTGYLRRCAEKGLIELIPEEAQEVDLAELTGLESGDLLFIDSTHCTLPGSEVNRVILEALPRLKPGCNVHFHDIYFPYDYQSHLMYFLFFLGESSLLQAYLIDNQHCSISTSLSMLHHACPERLKSVFPRYQPLAMKDGLHAVPYGQGHFPSATYLSTH